ncbi:hypothetical protein NMY22_g13109 [Coprinellus aureogranulatus]|nr:hypothetical protein NMY22_g13109 [Coprinellus aureogranulatus]
MCSDASKPVYRMTYAICARTHSGWARCHQRDRLLPDSFTLIPTPACCFSTPLSQEDAPYGILFNGSPFEASLSHPPSSSHPRYAPAPHIPLFPIIPIAHSFIQRQVSAYSMADRISFTFNQLIEMRVGAAELLRAIQRHSNLSDFENDWWSCYTAVNGLPVPNDWDEVPDYEEFIDEYRARVFRGVRWHAFRGRFPPSNREARMNRIEDINESITADRNRLIAIGADMNAPVTTDYTVAPTTATAVDAAQQQVEQPKQALDFTTFSFDASSPVDPPFSPTIDPTSPFPTEQHTFPHDLSIDTSFMQMQDWSACSSPVSPSPSFSMPSTPSFEAQSPAFVSSPSPAPAFVSQIGSMSFNEKGFSDYNQYNLPSYQQNLDGFGADGLLGMDQTGYGDYTGMNDFGVGSFGSYDPVPPYAF